MIPLLQRLNHISSFLLEDWSSSHLGDMENSPSTVQSQDGSPGHTNDTMSDRLLESFPSPTSATSAGSVPSPNSPPDSATVAASRNTEMVAKMDSSSISKQSMISVITYPHQLRFVRKGCSICLKNGIIVLNNIQILFCCSQLSENFSTKKGSYDNSSDIKPGSVSVSTQTDCRGKSEEGLLKTTSTQTAENLLPVSQSTPLLSSLICNQRPEDSFSMNQEASTTPSPSHDLVTSERTGGWAGVDGVNGSNVPWDLCASSVDGPDRNVDEDVLQDVLR